MGWSESHYEDMRREALETLGSRAGPLLEEIRDFHNILTTYRDFVDSCDDMEGLLRRLEECLAEYRVDD